MRASPPLRANCAMPRHHQRSRGALVLIQRIGRAILTARFVRVHSVADWFLQHPAADIAHTLSHQNARARICDVCTVAVPLVNRILMCVQSLSSWLAYTFAPGPKGSTVTFVNATWTGAAPQAIPPRPPTPATNDRRATLVVCACSAQCAV